MSNGKKKMTLDDLSLLYELPVLFIEDELDYANELFKQAKEFHFNLKHEKSLEGAKEFLATEEGKTIRGIILDIVCLKQKDEVKPDKSFITEAKQYFDRTHPHLPVVAITGFPSMREEILSLFKDVLPVFTKMHDEKQMFKYLRGKALDHEKLKIRCNYQDIFETIDKYFSREAEDSLVWCLQDMGSTDKKIIEGTLTRLRKLQESFYIAINKLNKEMVPDELVFNKKGNPKLVNEKIIKHLKGNFDKKKMMATTREYIEQFSDMDMYIHLVYNLCSGEIHITAQKTSRYTVQAAVNAFLDMVLWLRRRLGQGKQ